MNLMKKLEDYAHELHNREHAAATIQKYVHDVKNYLGWCDARHLDSQSKDQVLRWRDAQAQDRAPATVNAAVAAVNGFLRFIGRSDCCVRPLRVQRRLYRELRMELTREEYFRLLRAAEGTSEQTAGMLEALCATGIRVSELRYVTVQAVRQGFATVRNKGKCRTILLPRRLQALLKRYCMHRGITSGPVFTGKHGQPLSRYAIWRRMKQLCAAAQVAPQKVFPHNLRHLFAVCFYRAQHDLEHLADILGHSNIN
ncbi:MAG: tyrosine-type recombinase/integrase, partial [Aristaeellaceae bacterium]